jgi:hypothetical protein
MSDEMPLAIQTLERAIADASASLDPSSEAAHEHAQALRDLAVRGKKLSGAWGRPPCLGFFGPSQAGKSFLVGALLSHELGSLQVVCPTRELDFLKEINPAKGVESTGVVTRFSTQTNLTPQAGPHATRALTRGDFQCQLLSLELVLESLATGFLVECTSPAVDPERVERCLRDARLQAGAAAPAMYLDAWESVWHDLNKKYQDRHPYLNDLRRQSALHDGAWKKEVKTAPGWLLVYSLLWGGPGHANDLDAILRHLVQGLEAVGHARTVEVALEHVRASSDGVSVIDAGCLNSLGTGKTPVRVHAQEAGRDVTVEPGILSALIAEIRLPLKRVEGSLLDKVDILDFPGGRALKGINGFGRAELNTGKLDNAVEVYKRGKLTFLFEQFSLDREITALCLCSPGPTKPEAVQLQSQVESWIKTRYGASSPGSPQEVDDPSLFVALTKYDMSLGALRSDNAKDRWDSRVQEACVDFWARSGNSWLTNWGAKGRPFDNMFWIRNPYADQMQAVKPGTPDYETIKQGYLGSRAVQRHVKAFEEKWLAVEGDDDDGGSASSRAGQHHDGGSASSRAGQHQRPKLPKSGVPLLAQSLRRKLSDDVKAKELRAEAIAIRGELLTLLRAMTPSKDAAEERARILENAQELVNAVSKEMSRRCSGAVFGELLQQLVPMELEIEREVRKAYGVVAPMSIKTSDKVKKVLVHVLKWWVAEGVARVRRGELAVPASVVDVFVREVCTSKLLLPVLGNAIYPYFSRNVVDTGLVATILQVKVSDAMTALFNDPSDRQTPAIPARLSYSENVGGGAAGALEGGAIDWSNVDFDEDISPHPASGAPGKALGISSVELVFAGSRTFKRWGARLGDFYLESRGGQAKVAPDDPRVQRLVSVMKEVEKVHVAPG